MLGSLHAVVSRVLRPALPYPIDDAPPPLPRRQADGGVYNSLQFEAFLRYFNRSGNGLLHFNANGR